MKILAIRIKNLASLDGITEIDFDREPLRSAGIFAITGPTGAGKSTVLDALCLALYAKTPRYNQAKEMGVEIQDVNGATINQGDTRGILRDGTADGFAEVDFVGADGQPYRAQWSVKRARNRADGNLQAYNSTLLNIKTNVLLPGKKGEILEEIERLVGLNFEQFTRSVLLAQGDFTAFLKAGKDEKSSLLEKLTGTQIYSGISKGIFEKYKEADAVLRELRVRKEGVDTLSEEEIVVFGERMAVLEADIKRDEQQLKEVGLEIDWFRRMEELEAGVAAAIQEQEEALRAKSAVFDREQQLKQVELVQVTRSWVDALRVTEEQLAGKTAGSERLDKELVRLQEEKEGLESLLKLAGDELSRNTRLIEEAMPLLEEAKVLDVQIGAKKEQVARAAEELKLARGNYDKHQQDLQMIGQEVERSRLAIEEMEKWKKDNANRQGVAENSDLIIGRLADAQKLLDGIKAGELVIGETVQKIEKAEQQKGLMEGKMPVIGEELKGLRTAYEGRWVLLSGIVVEDWEEEKRGIDNAVEAIIIADAHWKVLYATLNDVAGLGQKLDRNKEELRDKTEVLGNIFAELGKAEAAKAVSFRMLEKANRAAAENVENLRAALVDGEPCPVCGSAEHPYAAHDLRLGHMLTEMEEEHRRNEAAYTRYLTEYSGLQNACEQLVKLIGEAEAELRSKRISLDQLNDRWMGLAIRKDSDVVPDAEKAAWLSGKLAEVRGTQKGLQDRIQNYYIDKRALDEQKKEMDKLETVFREYADQVREAERAIQSQRELLEHYQSEQEKIQGGFSGVEQALLPFFGHREWVMHWKNNSVSFVERISVFAALWKSNMEKLLQDMRRHGESSAGFRVMQEQAADLFGEVEKKDRWFAEQSGQHVALDQKRKGLFDGQAVELVEARLRQDADLVRQRVDKHRAELEELRVLQERSLAQRDQIARDIVGLLEQQGEQSGKVGQWLEREERGLDLQGLVRLLAYTTEWREMERSFLRGIDDVVAKAAVVLSERQSLLRGHEKLRSSAVSLEELKLGFEERTKSMEKARTAKNEIGFLLQQDAENKRKIGDLSKHIGAAELVAENWGKLNDIIGSSDGKKFRQIAQEYTLDLLLSYANVHLTKLTKRYQIQRIPHTLGLQVLDQDMGNEVRTVYSLSGGESFLVSLALALGLASLSSSRMKVESLFIDEGFGSLDPATLNIAMDALERLHNQGRKVGVISHVQEMTERIAVQIKVSKQASGKSAIEVLG